MKLVLLNVVRRVLYCLFLFVTPSLYAEVYIEPHELQAVIGHLQYAALAEGDSLVSLAARKRLGQNEILLANPKLDRWLPETDALVTLPTLHLLPDVTRKGIVINLPEYRLYVYDTRNAKGEQVVRTYPVSIGRYEWTTPEGQTTIIRKITNPTWTPPESIRREAAENGHTLPAVVAAGPDNPLGQYALQLGWSGYLIHGTNKPMAIGMNVTHGCLRMYPSHIEMLYTLLPLGTSVAVVNMPVKIGWKNEQLYLEVHPPLESTSDEHLLSTVIKLLRADARAASLPIRSALIRKIVQERSGIPTVLFKGS